MMASRTAPDRAAILAFLGEARVAPVAEIRRAVNMTAARAYGMLLNMEASGVVQRYYNPDGPQQPWWWQATFPKPIPDSPWADRIVTDIESGSIWDWGPPDNRLWVTARRDINSWGCRNVYVHSGTHNAVSTVVPGHYFGTVLHPRKPGATTAWSTQFSCPAHGECTEEMVTTAKTCALCGLLLNRHLHGPGFSDRHRQDRTK